MIARLDLPASPLCGEYVRLEPLRLDHVPGLAAAASAERSTFALTTVPDGVEGTRRYVEVAMALAEVGAAAPFATIDAKTDRVAGSTRFANLEHIQTPADVGSPAGELVRGAAVEIGWTWLTPPAQRTAINTEAKLLMLTHAFEVWGLWRVVLRTHEHNARSRAAIERLGATLDGVVRNHLPNGEVRKAACYSIGRSDWPATQRKLKTALLR